VNSYTFHLSVDNQRTGAIALVVHGLNTAPAAMLPLVQWLNQQSAEVYQVQLSGHHPGGTELKQVTADIWQQEMLTAYLQAKKAADEKTVPLFFIGYSLGALLGQSMVLLPSEEPTFHKQVLISPAFTLRRRAYLLRALFFLPSQFLLPGFTPKAYRVNNALPLRLYRILFQEAGKVLRAKGSQLNIPTLVLMDPRDELISHKALQHWIWRRHLTNYKLITLNPSLAGRRHRYHHLILDEATMGKENWQTATIELKGFLFAGQEE
jgi:esterase/lipase